MLHKHGYDVSHRVWGSVALVVVVKVDHDSGCCVHTAVISATGNGDILLSVLSLLVLVSRSDTALATTQLWCTSPT